MVVCVDWEDASFHEMLVTPEVAKTIGKDPYISRSVGWLVHRDKKHVIIALQQINNGQLRDLLTVPMPLVRKITRLKFK